MSWVWPTCQDPLKEFFKRSARLRCQTAGNGPKPSVSIEQWLGGIGQRPGQGSFVGAIHGWAPFCGDDGGAGSGAPSAGFVTGRTPASSAAVCRRRWACGRGAGYIQL